MSSINVSCRLQISDICFPFNTGGEPPANDLRDSLMWDAGKFINTNNNKNTKSSHDRNYFFLW